MIVDLLYIEARSVLLDALDALSEHLAAITVVGAQAVYLRTGPIDIGVAAYTSDGDLALDPSLLLTDPLLDEVLGAAFHLQQSADGHANPGAWAQIRDVDGKPVTIPLDLMVPTGIALPGRSRGARLPPHSKFAARKAAGLEAAVVDADIMTIESLNPADNRAIPCRVAGPTALLIAKAHKIQDRLDEPGRDDRVKDKDAADVYRLMQTTPVETVRSVATGLLRDGRAADATGHGLDLLGRQFGARLAPGVQMATRALRVGVPAARVEAVCVAFVEGLRGVEPGS